MPDLRGLQYLSGINSVNACQNKCKAVAQCRSFDYTMDRDAASYGFCILYKEASFDDGIQIRGVPNVIHGDRCPEGMEASII